MMARDVYTGTSILIVDFIIINYKLFQWNLFSKRKG